eukprot:1129619-Amphidinium_carterae.1
MCCTRIGGGSVCGVNDDHLLAAFSSDTQDFGKMRSVDVQWYIYYSAKASIAFLTQVGVRYAPAAYPR